MFTGREEPRERQGARNFVLLVSGGASGVKYTDRIPEYMYLEQN